MKRKKYLKPLGDLLINVGSFLHSGSRIDGIESSMNRIPLELLEDLKDLIDGEIIFRNKKELNDSVSIVSMESDEIIH